MTHRFRTLIAGWMMVAMAGFLPSTAGTVLRVSTAEVETSSESEIPTSDLKRSGLTRASVGHESPRSAAKSGPADDAARRGRQIAAATSGLQLTFYATFVRLQI